MANNRVLTRDIGNLRGFSTSSPFTRPSNVADKSINIQKAPDDTMQLRRGYQCQIATIGGMGIGTFDDPSVDEVKTVTVGLDGYLYNKLQKQIFIYYNGQVTGVITNITNPSADLTQVTSVGHGLQTGASVIIRNVVGSVELNNNTYTVTVVDANNFILDGVLFSSLTAYSSGGYFSIAFADMRYLSFTIFTDPRYINSNVAQSITCNITVNRAAQVNGAQTLTNTINVDFGHELAATDVVIFKSSVGVTTQRNVVSVTSTSITIDGTAVSVSDNIYISQFFDILFGKGFDVASPATIQDFIDIVTDVTTGVHGLQISINGDSNKPAAFLQIVEPTIIDSNSEFEMNYWYWEKVNFTSPPPFPGSANIIYQNSPQFEIAAMAAFDDVIYITNGWDYPQKYDGQTVYRTGMPIGRRPSLSDNTTFLSKPFVMTNVYEYATSYEQIDNRGHIVEGEISEVRKHTVAAATAAIDVEVINLQSSPSKNWNTNGALAVGGISTSYGPDVDGYYYDLTMVDTGYTLKIGDSAYYGDVTAAVLTGAPQPNTTVLNVSPGNGALPGDTIYFFDSAGVERQRIVTNVDTTTITIEGEDVSVNSALYPNILIYEVSLVFGNVAIINASQSNVNTINVFDSYPASPHTIQLGDIVEFQDSSRNVQRRTVTGVTATSITIDGIPVNVVDLFIIASINQRSDAINLRRPNPNAATLSDGIAPNISNAISNNLRINIYRTMQGESFGVNGELFLVASIPNDSSGVGVQVYIDGIPDLELGRQFDDPDQAPNPPPISKYVLSFGNQLFYAGGERGKPANSDNVFFSDGNSPEVVPLATNFFSVPNVDDDITGIGVAGSTLVTTKNSSIWASTGNFLSGQIEVVQIAKGTNIGCVAHATIASVGTLMYFVHTNGVYSITENQLFPTDEFGNPVPISFAINSIFRETNFLKQNRYVFKRAVAVNYTKDNQYWLFIPCEDTQTNIRTANSNSVVLCYDHEGKNWFNWNNINAAGGMVVIDDDIYFQERRFSPVDGNVANLYKQHRFYRLVDHADHAGPQRAEWLSSWEDLGQPEVRKKFSKCVLLMDRISSLQQYNDPVMVFSTYLNRLPNLQNTISTITQVDNIRNSPWSTSGWGWNYWSGYQDTFISVNLRQGTVAKSIQVGFKIEGINMDIRLAGFQLEAIPENRKTIVR